MANLSDEQKVAQNEQLISMVESGDIETVLTLLAEGADPDARNDAGDTLLNIALTREVVYPELIESLVEGGAHVNYVGADRVTPLMCAVYNLNVPLETVEYLLQAGAGIYSRDTYGQTPLLYATGRGDATLVDLLLQYGASVNEADADGNTLVQDAVRQGHVDLFNYLVDQGVDLTVRDYQGKTLLMAAIDQKQIEMAELLLDYPEVDVLAERVDGLTALDMVQDTLKENKDFENDEKARWETLLNNLTDIVSFRLRGVDFAETGSLWAGEGQSDWYAEDVADEEGALFGADGELIGDGFDSDIDEETIADSEEDDFVYTFEEPVSGEDEDVVFELEDPIDEDVIEEDDIVYELEDPIDEDVIEEDDIVYELEDPIDEDDDYGFDETVAGEDEPEPVFFEGETAAEEDDTEPVFFEDETAAGEDDIEPVFFEDETAAEEDDTEPVFFGDETAAEEDDTEPVFFEDEIAAEEDDTEPVFFESETAAEEDDSEPVFFEGETAAEDDDTEPVFLSDELVADEKAVVADLPQKRLYVPECYDFALKRLRQYVEYPGKEGEKGLYVSGVCLNEKACAQARIHIERVLLNNGYTQVEAYNHSGMLLYKLIQANFLYHPLETAKFVADGEQATLSNIYGLNHRTLLQQLIQSDELDGDWMGHLESIEETINAKGQAILFTDNEGQWYAPGEQSGYYMG